MTTQALASLLDWATKSKRVKQKEFISFYKEKNEAYRFDESCGANGSGLLNMTMIERMIKDFEEVNPTKHD